MKMTKSWMDKSSRAMRKERTCKLSKVKKRRSKPNKKSNNRRKSQRTKSLRRTGSTMESTTVRTASRSRKLKRDRTRNSARSEFIRKRLKEQREKCITQNDIYLRFIV